MNEILANYKREHLVGVHIRRTDHKKCIENSPLQMFIEKMDEPLERVVCDYIAGMSDQYSVAKFEEIFVPASWKV